MVGSALLVAWLVLSVAGAGLTVWLVRRVWKQRTEARPATKVLAFMVAASAIFGALGSLLGFVTVFGAVGGVSVDPSQKARLVGEGISEAMNCAALGLMVWVPSTVAALVMTRRSKAKSG